jgi:hypothetical protein
MNLRLRWHGLGTPLGPDKMAVGGWGMWTCWLRGGRGDAIKDMGALTKLDISGNNIGAEQEGGLQRICVAGGIELAK